MDDPDIFAYLYPAKDQGREKALKTIRMEENHSRYLPPQTDNGRLKPAHETNVPFVREATEEPDEEDNLDLQHCLALRFSDPPPTRQGAVAGRSPNAFIRLPSNKGISWYHFAVTFDKHFHMMVQDLNSMVGTQLIYDGAEGPPGHGIAWSTCGPTTVKGKPPVIKVVEDLQFTLIVPTHDLTSQIYRDNVTRYLQGTAPPEDLVSDLEILSRTRTELPSGGGEVHTAPTKILKSSLWKRELGYGSFGVVSYAWDVTSREEFALKEPRPDTEGDWEKEARIMKNISHVGTRTLM